MPRKVFITVAEASGDLHASNLIRELRALEPDIRVEGIGGDAMRQAGAIVHRDTVKRAAFGWRAMLRYIELKRVLNWSRRYFLEYQPDLHICIDSWAMNWHFARMAHQQGVPVLYYIAPQMWASRPGRVKRLRRYVDHVACILPFEEQFFRDHHVEATFVGHPLFDALPHDRKHESEERFPAKPPVIGLLPGSRSSVARANFSNMLDVASRIQKEFPETRFLIPTVAATHQVVAQLLGVAAAGNEQTSGPFTFALNRIDEMVPRCDLCITVSGTASLQVAALGVPHIVVYRVSPFIWHVFARWIVKTRTYSLVNLLGDGHVAPEFIPWYGSNRPVGDKALEYLHNPKMMTDQRQRQDRVVRTLDRPGASRNTAKLAVELMKARGKTRVV